MHLTALQCERTKNAKCTYSSVTLNLNIFTLSIVVASSSLSGTNSISISWRFIPIEMHFLSNKIQLVAYIHNQIFYKSSIHPLHADYYWSKSGIIVQNTVSPSLQSIQFFSFLFCASNGNLLHTKNGIAYWFYCRQSTANRMNGIPFGRLYSLLYGEHDDMRR